MEESQTVENEVNKEALSKFLVDFENFKDSNIELIEDIQEVVDVNELPSISGEALLYFAYGAELANRELSNSNSVGLPNINYDPNVYYEKQDSENNTIYLGSKLLNQFLEDVKLDETGEYNFDPNKIADIVSFGAHAYAHIIFDEKVDSKKWVTSEMEYHRQRKNYERSGDIVDYDSSIIELMALNWEKKILNKHTPWAKKYLKQINRRINNAQEKRREQKNY